MNKPIVIVGGDGLLGQELARAFDGRARTLTRIELDVTDKDAVLRMLGDGERVIINATGYTNVNEAEKNEALAMRVNAEAVGYLAQAAKDSGSTLVHFSTDYVFDGKNADGYAEDAKPGNPLNVYGKSKLAGEEAIRTIDPNHYLIRTSWLYGMSGTSFPHTMMQLAHERGALSVVNDQHGKPTYAADVASTVRAMVGESGEGSTVPFGTYHVINEEATTWYDFAQEIFRIAGLNPTLTPVTTEAFAASAARPEWSILLNTKLPPLRTWREAIADYLGSLPKDYLLDTTG